MLRRKASGSEEEIQEHIPFKHIAVKKTRRRDDEVGLEIASF